MYIVYKYKQNILFLFSIHNFKIFYSYFSIMVHFFYISNNQIKTTKNYMEN